MSPSQRRISAPRSLDRDVSLEDFRTSKVLGEVLRKARREFELSVNRRCGMDIVLSQGKGIQAFLTLFSILFIILLWHSAFFFYISGEYGKTKITLV